MWVEGEDARRCTTAVTCGTIVVEHDDEEVVTNGTGDRNDED